MANQKHKTNETICWYCKRCTGGCSWMDFHEPVKGWKATPTLVYHMVNTPGVPSYCVNACPLYEPYFRELPRRLIAELLDVDIRTVFRYSVDKVLGLLLEMGHRVEYYDEDGKFYEFFD